MNKKLLFLIIPMMICGIVDAGCAKKQSPNDKILAKVSNKTITLKEFKARIAKLPSYYQHIIDRNKKRYLDEIIMETLLYEEAVRKGLDKDREVKEVIIEAKKKILVAKLIKNEVEDNIKVTDAEMRQFYGANKEQFKSSALWRASHILVASEKDAKDMLDSLSKGASFEELARTHSMDATASRGGDIGYFRIGQLVPDFEKTCLKLNVGEISDILRTQFGYHIIKLTDKKEPVVQNYEKVRGEIEEELKKRKRSELFDHLVLSLKNKYGVEIKEDVFKSLDGANKESQTAAKQ